MSDETNLATTVRILERRTLVLQIGLGIALLPWLFAASREFASGPGSDVLRARGLIIEDAQGRARILLGAPAPAVQERARKDAATGIVLLSEDGKDRLQLGNVGGPQMGGVVQERIASATGLQVNDAKGDERGGFGLLDNGRMTLGLDSPEGEGVMLFVAPDLGMNGLMINGRGKEDVVQRASLVVDRDANAVLKISDAGGSPRVEVGCEKVDPILRELDPKGQVVRDLRVDERPNKK